MIRLIKQWAGAVMLVAGLMTGLAPHVQAAEEPLDAQSYIVIEQKSGKILAQNNQDQISGIASMSKMLTHYLVFQAVEQGEVSWEDKLSISDRASALSTNYSLSNVPLRTNETYTVRELLEASVIYSANAATLALAEGIGGSEEAWLKKMQELTSEWGLADAMLINVTGLPNEYGGDQKKEGVADDTENAMSAKSVAYIARRLVLDYPEILEISSVREKDFHPDTIDETKMTNFNYLLEGSLFGRSDVTGLKTGTSSKSGASITTTAQQDDLAVIVVVMGSQDPLNRFRVTSQLLDDVFKKYEALTIGQVGKSIQNLSSFPVSQGSEERITLNYGSDFIAAVPKGTAASQIKIAFDPNPDFLDGNGALQAPITKGQNLGNLTFQVPGEDFGYVDGSTYGQGIALAAYEIQPASLAVQKWRQTRDWFREKFQVIEDAFKEAWSKVLQILRPANE